MVNFRHLKRSNIINLCEDFIAGQERLLIIRGGAGYGKSISATQITEECDKPFAICQCTTIDKNPTILLENILASVNSLISDVNYNEIIQALANSGSSAETLMVADVALKKILPHNSRKPIGIIIEDAHVLLNSPYALQMLRLFFDLMPDHYSLVITTRYVLTDGDKLVFQHKEGIRITQTHLSFNVLETLELYRHHYGIDLTYNDACMLHEGTGGGWATGLFLLRSQRKAPSQPINITDQHKIDKFFIKECLSFLPSSTVAELVLLAQLDNIPVEMLTDFNLGSASHSLDHLYQHNLFVHKSYDKNGTHYNYHQLFLSTLRSLSVAQLLPQDIVIFYNRASKWLVEHDRIEEAMLLHARDADWNEIVSILASYGPSLLTNNRLTILVEAVSECPHDTLMADAWLSTMLGHAVLLDNPAKGIKLLENGLSIARDNQDSLCELLAGMGIIYFQVVINGNLRAGRNIVDRVWELYNLLSSKNVPPDLEGQCCYILSIAYGYSTFNATRAADLAELSRIAYSKQRNTEIVPEAIISKVYINGLLGNIQEGVNNLQELYILQYSHLVSPSLRFMSLLIYLNYSIMLFDLDNYNLLRAEAIERYSAFIENTNLGLFINLYDMEILMSKGNFSKLLILVDETLRNDSSPPSAHMKIMCLEYRAMALAFQGERQQAIISLFESMRMRAKVGGAYFILKNHMIAGCVLSLIGGDEKAERIFSCCLERSVQAREYYNRPLIYAYRARLRISKGRYKEARDDINQMLLCLEHFNNYHFFHWTDELLLDLLQEFANHIEIPTFARKLIRKHFNSDVLVDGKILPRLRCNLSKGKIFITNSPDIILDFSELREKERTLLELLVQNNEKPISVTIAIDHLWNDSNRIKDPRNSLYQIINRLRMKLSTIVRKRDVKHYLMSNSGFLSFEHIDVDVHLLTDYAKQCISSFEKKQYWNSDLHFRQLIILADHFPEDYILPEKIAKVVVSAAKAWLDFLINIEENSKALSAVELGLKFDPMNDDFHKKRYRIYLEMDMLLKAKEAEKEYHALLTKEYGPSNGVSDLLE